MKSLSNVRAHKRAGLLTFLFVIFIADFVAGFVYGYISDTRDIISTRDAGPSRDSSKKEVPAETDTTTQAAPVKAEIAEDEPDDASLDDELLDAFRDSADEPDVAAAKLPDDKPVKTNPPADEPEQEPAAPDKTRAVAAKPPKPKVESDPETDLFRHDDEEEDETPAADTNVAKGDEALEQAGQLLRKWMENRSQSSKAVEAKKALQQARKALDEALAFYEKADKENPDPATKARIQKVQRLRYDAMKSSGT
ncbi:MAG TPA: hypothetical protein VM141_09575 [Planctomycetota bacterium]|nr:hypothetical protein [Planctomycetota bacterium]